jgi:hypothetical protein
MAVLHTLVVVQKAPNQDLVTLEDMRIEFGFPSSQDAKMARWITQASAAVAAYTRRVWRQETVTETWHNNWFDLYYSSSFTGDPKPLVLTRYPVSSVAMVAEGDTDLTDTQWILENQGGLLYRTNDWAPDPIPSNPIFPGVEPPIPDPVMTAWCGNTVTVTYTAGYLSTNDIPADVQQACTTLLAHRSSSSRRDPALRSIDIPGVQAETYWVGQIGENGALPPEVVGLLTPHIDMRS